MTVRSRGTAHRSGTPCSRINCRTPCAISSGRSRSPGRLISRGAPLGCRCTRSRSDAARRRTASRQSPAGGSSPRCGAPAAWSGSSSPPPPTSPSASAPSASVSGSPGPAAPSAPTDRSSNDAAAASSKPTGGGLLLQTPRRRLLLPLIAGKGAVHYAAVIAAGQALRGEPLQDRQVGLAIGGELGDLVEQGGDGDLGADCQRGLVDPLAGQRRDRPGPGQDAALPVGEQPQGAAGVTLVGPRPGHRISQRDLGRHHVDAAVAGLAGGEAHCGDL